jgi:hypothetical protein
MGLTPEAKVVKSRRLWRTPKASPARETFLEDTMSVSEVSRPQPVWIQASELDFDRISLLPHLTLENKVRTLVTLRHVWILRWDPRISDSSQADPSDVYSEIWPEILIDAELGVFGSEVRKRVIERIAAEVEASNPETKSSILERLAGMGRGVA